MTHTTETYNIFPLNNNKSSMVQWKEYTMERVDIDIANNLYGIGVPQGLFVIDIDCYKEGCCLEEVLDKLNISEDIAEKAYLQTTRSGGHHYCFKTSVENMPNTTNFLGIKNVDTRSAGKGYIATGKGYQMTAKLNYLMNGDTSKFPKLPPHVYELMTTQFKNKTGKAKVILEPVARIKSVLSRIPASVASDSSSWFNVMCGLHNASNGSEEVWEYFDEWSSSADNYDEAENRIRWESLSNKTNNITFATVVSYIPKVVSCKTGLDNFVYIKGRNRYVNIETLEVMCAQAFMMELAGMGITTGNTAKLQELCVNMDRAYDTLYSPIEGRFFFVEGKRYLNTYRKTKHNYSNAKYDCVEAMTKHVKNLLSDPREQDLLFSWLAHQIQKEGHLNRFAILLAGPQGNGKSYFGEVIRKCLGDNNIGMVSSESLTNKFNSFASGSSVNIINELSVDTSSGRKLMDTIKPLITDPVLAIEGKCKDCVNMPNFTNYLCTTNHYDALPIKEGDRRFCVLFTEKPNVMDSEYFRKLFVLLEDADQVAGLHKWLSEYIICDEIANGSEAPHTKAKDRMLENCKSDAELSLEYALNLFQGPDANESTINVTYLNNSVTTHLHSEPELADFPSGNKLASILIAKGYNKKRVRIGNKQRTMYVK